MAYNENSSVLLTPFHLFPKEVSFTVSSTIYSYLLLMIYLLIFYAFLFIICCPSLFMNEDSAC